jgi:hypothetical protein
MGRQWSATGSSAPPLTSNWLLIPFQLNPPQMIISLPVQTAL